MRVLAALLRGAYDVILCDIHMPDLDGPGFYREVERHYPTFCRCIIFLKGEVLSPEVQPFCDQVSSWFRLYDAHCDSFLVCVLRTLC